MEAPARSWGNLDSGGIDVWALDLAAYPGEVSQALVTGPERVELAGTIRLRARAALRTVLAGYLQVAPFEVPIVQPACVGCGRPHGRPRLTTDRLSFSHSHSGDLALVAVATDGGLGADVEITRPTDHIRMARRFYSPRERRAVAAGGAGELTRLWVRKESVGKAAGVPHLVDMLAIDVLDDELEVAGVGPCWTVSLPTAPGWRAAVAATGGRRPVRLRGATAVRLRGTNAAARQGGSEILGEASQVELDQAGVEDGLAEGAARPA